MQRSIIAGLVVLWFLLAAAPASADVNRQASSASCANGTVTVRVVFDDPADQPINGTVYVDMGLRGPTADVSGFTFVGQTGALVVTIPDAISDEGSHWINAKFDWPGRASSENPWFLDSVSRCIPHVEPKPDPQLEPIALKQARAAVRGLLSHPKRWQFSARLEDTRKVILEGTKRRTGTVRFFTVTRRFDGLLHVDVGRRSPA